MKFALHNVSFLPTTHNPQDIWPELRDRAQWLDAHGFEYLSVMDHLWQIPGMGSPDEPFMEGWMALAGLAASTERLKLTTLVTGVNYRNPALVVKMVTTLDLISGGRAILGIGGGWYQGEYDAYGYGKTSEFPRPGVRLGRLREAVQIAKLMWQEPRASYEGKHYLVKDAILEPKPLQQPRPRILIGGGGEKVTLRIVAEEADMCNMGGGPEVLAHKLAILSQHCQAVGRDMSEIEITTFDRLILAPTEAKAEDKWRAQGSPQRDGYRGVMGTPEQVIQQLQTYQEAGAHTILFMIPNDDAESRELLAAEVMPAFR